VGTHSAEVLAEHFGSIDELAQAKPEELKEIQEVGPVMAGSISKFLSDPHTRAIIKRLKDAGVNTERLRKKERAEGSKIAGMTFVVTGTLENYSRNEAEDLIKKMGGRVSSSVSKNTDFVLAGESPGSKLDNARKLGIRILSETEFERLISSS